MYMQRVHVGAEPDGGPVAIALQGADDAGAGETAVDLDAELGELFRHEVAGRHLLESSLRMGVDGPAPFGHLGVEFRDAVDDGHMLSSPVDRRVRLSRSCAAG